MILIRRPSPLVPVTVFYMSVVAEAKSIGAYASGDTTAQAQNAAWRQTRRAKLAAIRKRLGAKGIERRAG